MSTRALSRRIDRLARRIPAPAAPVTTSTPLDAEAEARAFAAELRSAYGAMVAARRREEQASLYDAHKWADSAADAVYRERLLHGPPSEATWAGLDRLAREDPALASTRWQVVRQAAQDELQTGYGAARAAGIAAKGPWALARFLAVREAILGGLPTCLGAALLLADAAAQAYTLFIDAIERVRLLNQVLAGDPDGRRPVGPGKAEATEALRETMAAAKHWHGILASTIHALRDFHGGSVPVHIERALQVNLASQQVNLAGRAVP